MCAGECLVASCGDWECACQLHPLPFGEEHQFIKVPGLQLFPLNWMTPNQSEKDHNYFHTVLFTLRRLHKETHSIAVYNPEVQHYLWYYFYKARLLGEKVLNLHMRIHYTVWHQNPGAPSVHFDGIISEICAKSLSSGDTQQFLPSCLCPMADSYTWAVLNRYLIIFYICQWWKFHSPLDGPFQYFAVVMCRMFSWHLT